MRCCVRGNCTVVDSVLDVVSSGVEVVGSCFEVGLGTFVGGEVSSVLEHVSLVLKAFGNVLSRVLRRRVSGIACSKSHQAGGSESKAQLLHSI